MSTLNPFIIHCGDALSVLKTLLSESVQCCVTSPPYYGLRDYGTDGQIGLEASPEAYVEKLVDVFHEIRRVLCDDGTLWLNVGDSYVSKATGGLSSKPSLMTGGRTTQFEGSKRPDKRPQGTLKTKDLIGIPWMLAFALRADGWYLRSDIIWSKPNPMPESVKDRPTKAHEYLFLLSKREKYFYDAAAILEPTVEEIRGIHASKGMSGHYSEPDRVWGASGGRNKRSVWTVATKPYKGAHFATMPPALVEPCILAGCPVDGTVLDPFSGAGTTGIVAVTHSRSYIGIELNPEYVKLSHDRYQDSRKAKLDIFD